MQITPPVRPTAPLLVALLLPVALASSPAAQEEAQEPRSTTASDDYGARASLVHLEDGRVLRVRARRTAEAGWEIQLQNAWSPLAETEVVRVVSERELLSQARRLERAAGDDSLRRVAYADWLVREGLLAEAAEALDDVLAEDPDQTAARELLARAAWTFDLPELDPEDPETARAVLATAARGGALLRESAVQELTAAPEIRDLPDVLLEELVAQDHRRREMATLALRRVFPGRELQPLLGRALLDKSEGVRLGASLALRDADDPALSVPVLRAIGSQNAAVRQNAIDALGTMGYVAAVEPLYRHLVALQAGGSGRPPHSYIFVGRQTAYVQDFDVEVASGQAIADPVINVLTDGAVLDAAVLGVSRYVVQSESAAVRRSLARLTGARPGNTTAAWKHWWKEHGDEWNAGANPQGPPSSPSSPGD